MRTEALVAAALIVLTQVQGIKAGHAADLVWEVENPYRFFKRAVRLASRCRSISCDESSGASMIPIARIPRRRTIVSPPPTQALKEAGSAGLRKLSISTATTATPGHAVT